MKIWRGAANLSEAIPSPTPGRFLLRASGVLMSLFLSLVVAAAGPLPRVVLETDLGEIEIEIETEAARLTAANFLRYVDEGRFQGAGFYRVVTLDNQPDNDVRIEVIQGGLGFADNDQRLASIAHETTRTTGLLHLDGVVSMARNEPGTADAEIFICVGDQPALDFGGARNPDGQGFAAFGRVVRGMEVVRAIQGRPESGQMLTDPVGILSVHRTE